MTIIWTAQYKYSGPDRVDITTRRTHQYGQAFAPTWDLVNRYRNGQINENIYIHEYWTLMRKSYHENPESWRWLLSQLEVTLVCFCRPGTFCHRVILARDILGNHFQNVTYKGERTPDGRW